LIDQDIITEAVTSQFDSASRTVNVDLKEASKLTGHSVPSIIDAQNEIISLLLMRKAPSEVSNVASDVYTYRDTVISIKEAK